MSAPIVRLSDFVGALSASALAPWESSAPWELTRQAEAVVRRLLGEVSRSGFDVSAEIAVHESATVESGAVLKGPLILGPHCFVGPRRLLARWELGRRALHSGARLELKSSFVFAGTKLAHFNFVGDSILGADVNLEAGSILCNYRNERTDKTVRVRVAGALHPTGCEKFGAVVGDHCRVGANAVLAPGVLLSPGSVVPRASLRDDEVATA